MFQRFAPTTVQVVPDHEARVLHFLFVAATQPVQVGLPALAIRRIGEHEVEL